MMVTAADGRPLGIVSWVFRPGPGADRRTLARFSASVDAAINLIGRIHPCLGE
jgi:hypothetical protein